MARLDDVEAARVPESFRISFGAEVERRGVGAERVDAWLDEPNAFAFGDDIAKGRHIEAANGPVSIDGRRAMGRASESEKPKRAKNPAAPRRKAAVADPAKAAFVQQVALERLGAVGERGLIEAVLIAAIRARGKDDFSDLLPHEVTAVLRSLKDAGRVRYSAGRWMRAGRW